MQPSVTLLGSAQDGGVPQAGCSCLGCMDVHMDKSPELYPVSLGIKDASGKYHLIEASRTLPKQLRLWAESTRHLGESLDVISPISSVILTHLHLGHIDGIGQFGKEVIGSRQGSIRLISGQHVIDDLGQKSYLDPFTPEVITNGSKIVLGDGVALEFLRVPHREEECSETYGIVVRGKKKSILFLPDHDTYADTLKYHNMDSLRQWFRTISVDIVLLDGTFFSVDEVAGRRSDHSGIPHPTISESLNLLGRKNDADPDLIFIHLNHTNPVINENSKQRKVVEELKWDVGKQGQVWMI